MAYSVYWEEEVHIRPRGEIVVGDDGEKKRVLYRRHFLKFNYIPISQIACISSGDGELRIELKDGNEKCRLDYVKFGNMPMSRSKLEDCYHETSMELHPLGYYIVDEFVYVNDETAFVAAIRSTRENRIYVFKEWGGTGYLNNTIAAYIQDMGFAKSVIVADSAE